MNRGKIRKDQTAKAKSKVRKRRVNDNLNPKSINLETYETELGTTRRFGTGKVYGAHECNRPRISYAGAFFSDSQEHEEGGGLQTDSSALNVHEGCQVAKSTRGCPCCDGSAASESQEAENGGAIRLAPTRRLRDCARAQRRRVAAGLFGVDREPDVSARRAGGVPVR